MKISDEMIEAAKNISLTEVVKGLGYTPKKIGRYHTLKEMDSVRIYNDRTWCRFSGKGNKTGGTAIDFLMEYSGMSFVEAVIALTRNRETVFNDNKLMVENQTAIKENKKFVLPKKASDYRRVYAYLMQKRCLSKEVIDFFVKRKLLYEEESHHNIVFVGTDSEGNAKYATLRGTIDEKRFRGDVEGSDKNYNFHFHNKNSDELHIFESCIDMMSYMDINSDYYNNHLALGMLSDNPLIQFLKDYPHIKTLYMHLDNDGRATEAVYGNGKKQGLLEKYTELGYTVNVSEIPKEAGKDMNDLLVFIRKNVTI